MITDATLVLNGTVPATGVITGTSIGSLAAGAALVSLNTVDLSQARDIGEGNDLYVIFTVTTAVAGATLLAFEVIVSASDTLSSPTVVGSSGPIPLASLTANSQFAVRVNPVVASLGLRYFGCQARNMGPSVAASAGAYNAFVVTDIQDGKKYYASGFLSA